MKYYKMLFAMFNLTMYVDGGGGGGGGDGDGDGGTGDGDGSGDAGGDGDGGDAGAGAGGDGDGDGGTGDGDGDGEPTLLAGKYKDQDALEAGYKNLAQKFGTFTGTPEDGYAAIEGVENTTPDQNRLMAVLQEAGKEMGLNQEGYEGLYKNITEMQDRVAEENVKQVAADIPNYDTRVKAMVDTAGRVLRPDQLQALDAMMTTKESFEAFESMMTSMRGGSLPGSQQAPEVDMGSLRKELNSLSPSDTRRRTEILKEINKASTGEGRLV